MRVSINDHKQTVEVTRYIAGGIDKNTGKDVEEQTIKVATIDLASIQPLSGQEKITALEKGYEADHKLFAFKKDSVWLEGYSEFENGDKITDASSHKYTIEFDGSYNLTYQLHLKKVKK